jgi:hypothetical protein
MIKIHNFFTRISRIHPDRRDTEDTGRAVPGVHAPSAAVPEIHGVSG